MLLGNLARDSEMHNCFACMYFDRFPQDHSSQLRVSSEFDGVECRECVMSDKPRRVTRPWGRSRGARLINTIWKCKWPIS